MVQHLRTNVLQRKLFAEVIHDVGHPPLEFRGYVQVIRGHGSTRGHAFLISLNDVQRLQRDLPLILKGPSVISPGPRKFYANCARKQ